MKLSQKKKTILVVLILSLLVISFFYLAGKKFYKGKNQLELILSFVFSLILIPLILQDVRFGLTGFIVISVFPRLQARQMFGITGLNAMNVIFLITAIQFFIPRIFSKVKSLDRKIPHGKWIAFLFFLQSVYVLRILASGHYHADMTTAVLEQFVKPLQYYIILYILYYSIKKEKDVKLFFYAFYVGILIVISILFWQYMHHDPYSMIVWKSEVAGHKNAFAITLAIFILLLISLYFYSGDKKIKLFSLVGALAAFVIFCYSLSRTAWAAFLIGLLYLLYKMKFKKAIVFVFLLAFLLMLSPLSNMIMKRAARDLDTGDLDKITTGRVTGPWTVQWEGIKSNPILGGGYQSDKGHFGYLSVWNKIGILGLIITIILYIKIFIFFSTSFRSAHSKGIIKSLILAGLSIVVMVPFVNITASLQFIDLQDMGSIFLLFFIYLSLMRLLDIDDKARKKSQREVQKEQPPLQ